jgi:hypothetical protein
LFFSILFSANIIVLLNEYFHIKSLLCPRQSYWVEVSCIAYRADRGPIRLYEDIIQALYENTHFMTPLLTNDLKLQFVFLFFRCGHNYAADQDLIRLHDDLIQVLLILTGPYITHWQSKKSLIFILHMFFNIIIQILKFLNFFLKFWNLVKILKCYENFEILNFKIFIFFYFRILPCINLYWVCINVRLKNVLSY